LQAPLEIEEQVIVLRHMVLPQDLIDVDHSGSSMRFLRAFGPDIPMDLVDISYDDSSSTRDTTSPLDEEAFKFLAANRLCTDQLFHNNLIFGRKDKPTDIFFRGSTSSSGQALITVDQNAIQPALL